MAAKTSRLRFELGRMEVAGVVVSTAAGLFVVFLLGIYAGRGMAERHLEMDDEIVRLPVEVAPADSAEEDELTFYETLAGEARAAKRAEEAGTESAGRVAERDQAAPERSQVAAAGTDDADAPAAKPDTRGVDAGASKPAGADAAALAKTEEKAAPAAVQPKPSEDKARVAVALVDERAPAPPSTGGEWSVQVAATRDPRHAEQIRGRLKSNGFDAYVVQTRRAGETFHRVRVGHYASLDLAREAAHRLRGMPGVPEAFVTSN